ncbi:hypothetical protein M427DRAFT_81543, partial [Gonapodya prolifera JEL478]
PIILADTNRDGVASNADAADKAIWTTIRGAIFLPNIGDSDGRCPATGNNGDPLSDTEIAFCNDAAGNILYAPEYLAPLRTLPVSGVSNTTYGTVSAEPEEHASKVRIFWYRGPKGSESYAANWTYVPPTLRFNADALTAGLTLGVDGRTLVSSPDSWDGTIMIRFSATNPAVNHTADDVVTLRLAPVLTHHHLQRVDRLISVADNGQMAQKTFLTELDAACAASGLTSSLTLFNGTDIWAQDFFEPAYASMPGPKNSIISVRVHLRSAQQARTAGRQLFTQPGIRGKGVGAYNGAASHPSALGWREINSGGNIETIPPYVSKKTGKAYPAGRVIMAKHDEYLPSDGMLGLLQAQWGGIQEPLILQGGWLSIGHVDEWISFLPKNNSTLGWTISIADTTSALDVLRKAEKEGNGKVKARSTPPAPADFSGIPGFGPDDNITISGLLADKHFIKIQEKCQKYISDSLQTLLDETGVPGGDVVRIPMLFDGGPADGGLGTGGGLFGNEWGDDGTPPRYGPFLANVSPVGAFYPAAINGIVIGQSYIAARAYGPVVNGTDIIQAAVEEAYKKANMTPHFVNDFHSHHLFGGEVHCGTNTLRDTSAKWW